MDENKKENFKRISENRLNKTLILISQLKNLSNSSYYEYTDDEIISIFETIINESNKSRDALLKANEKKRQNRRIEL